MNRSLTPIAGTLMLVLAASCSNQPQPPVTPKSFDGDSKDLKTTEIVATLDAPLTQGKNTIWCASFLSAWKKLQKDLAGEPVALEQAPPEVLSLNNAADPRSEIPPEALYVAVGWKPKGILDKIQRELKQKFPTKPPPVFPDIRNDSFVAYAYLEANVKFPLPYFQSREPLEFTDSEGRKAKVTSFGIREEDDYAYKKLRAQPKILFWKGFPPMETGDPKDQEEEKFEYAVDLCADSSSSQIVVANIARQSSLADALAYTEEAIKRHEEKIIKNPDYSRSRDLGPNDVLLIPDLFWTISHRFSELEGKSFTNTKLKGQRLDVAQQDIYFRLDRSGAELKSESKLYCAPVPIYYVFDHPFLIYMKKRNAKNPYFAIWVDNAELLSPWDSKTMGQKSD
ncbi:MAG: hypothetical protein JXB10_02775 [Pirellulales bacterium]|nr:hypothetical protein [Pirellulales bacterium]